MINRVFLIGNIGKEVEVKATKSGKDMCVFSVATSSGIKKDGKWENETTWHNVIYFGDSATKFASKANTGSQVFVEGRISVSKYEDKNGNKQTKTSIIAEKVRLLSPQKDNDNGQNAPVGDDDVPF